MTSHCRLCRHNQTRACANYKHARVNHRNPPKSCFRSDPVKSHAIKTSATARCQEFQTIWCITYKCCWHAAACSHMPAQSTVNESAHAAARAKHRTSSTFCSQVVTHPGAFAAPGAMQCRHNPDTTHTAGLQGTHHVSVHTRVSIHTTKRQIVHAQRP
jgi:hypothetical protein